MIDITFNKNLIYRYELTKKFSSAHEKGYNLHEVP